MVVLGIRCSHTDITYAAVSGTKTAPDLLATETVSFPKGYPRPQLLKWVLQETDTMIRKHSIEGVVVKVYEGRKKGNDYELRVEAEGAVAIAAADNGIRAFWKKRKNTMAKDLGQKGRARYIEMLDTSSMPDFPSLSDKKQDATISAWSSL